MDVTGGGGMNSGRFSAFDRSTYAVPSSNIRAVLPFLCVNSCSCAGR
jgi:hypothetical protein